MDNLSDIAVFVKVVDCGSFTSAAEQLELSKSVVSKYVTRLEEQLGVRLLHRTTRKLSLTEAGRILYQRSQRGLEEIEAAEIEVSRLQRTPSGRLRFNTPMSFGILHIAPVLNEFQTEYPDINIDMVLEDRQVDLVEEGFDLAIRIAELPDSNLIARRLGPCKHVLCASPAYLEAHGTPQTPDDLHQHRTLTYGYHDSPREWRLLSPEGRYVSIPVNSAINMNNSLALREAVLQDAGIVLIPTFIVGPDIQTGRLTPILSNYRMQELSIYAIYPERKHLSPKVRAFIDFMSKKIGEKPDWEV
ncbi:LysR family transcriptional regulator [Thiomicrorhabdus sp.]|uniref:LysR family transcriptional regulator n=1 Tax=Thiomicrorhabdus sp. TaxID=2039724 RepID=UPI003564B565